MNVGNDRERADITDFAKYRRSASVHTPKSTLARRQDHPGAESHAPQSPLHASSMTVEHALGAPVPFIDFQNAFGCIRNHGPDSCCILGVKGKVADRLSQANLPFHALEFVLSDHAIWAHECNAASLPLGCLSSTTWIRRLQNVSIIRPIDAGSPWTWKGRTMSNSVLVRFYVAEEGNDAGFAVRGQDVHFTSQSLVGHEDLGELLPASASMDPRTEHVLETTVDDARRVRQIHDVHHISQRKVGQNGRVRITVDMPESVIPEATSNSCISLVPHSVPILGFYQSVEQWEELSSLLTKET